MNECAINLLFLSSRWLTAPWHGGAWPGSPSEKLREVNASCCSPNLWFCQQRDQDLQPDCEWMDKWMIEWMGEFVNKWVRNKLETQNLPKFDWKVLAFWNNYLEIEKPLNKSHCNGNHCVQIWILLTIYI